jgi:hypothetical protein
VGVGTWNAISRFDDVVVREHTQSASVQTTAVIDTSHAAGGIPVVPTLSSGRTWAAYTDWLFGERQTGRPVQPDLRAEASNSDRWANLVDGILDALDFQSGDSESLEELVFELPVGWTLPKRLNG